MKKYFTILIITCFTISCKQLRSESNNSSNDEIDITWVDEITDDFQFKNNWAYPEGVFINEFGQLSCDGICPPEVDKMKDKNEKIFNDSLQAFYKLIDTTHQYFSIQSASNAYEFSEVNFVTALKKSADTIICFTSLNSSTHSSLELQLIQNKSIPKMV